MYLNQLGLPFSASCQKSVDQFDAATRAYLAAETTAMELLDLLIEEDPQMPMAICFRAYLLKLAGHPRFNTLLAQCIEQLNGLITLKACNPREQLHIEAITSWHAGQEKKALQLLEQILLDHPLDMLALRIAHYLHFYNGIGALTRDSIERILPSWNRANPNYGFLLGMHAFGLEEAEDYAKAEEIGREAIDLNPADIWAAHAVAHVLEMQGRYEEGVQWIETLKPQWQDCNNFRHHLIWHQALHHIGLGDANTALDIYDHQLTECLEDDFYLDLCNAASLLWRLEFLDEDVGDRWQKLVEISEPHKNDKELLFASLHYLIPLTVRNSEPAQEMLSNFELWALSDTHQGHLCANSGLPLAQAIVAAGKEPERANQLLKSTQNNIYLIGGSTAQRDLFRLLSNNNAKRGGDRSNSQNWPDPRQIRTS